MFYLPIAGIIAISATHVPTVRTDGSKLFEDLSRRVRVQFVKTGILHFPPLVRKLVSRRFTFSQLEIYVKVVGVLYDFCFGWLVRFRS